MEYRNTKQRAQILKVLQSTTSHPTANWIYDRIKADFPNISLGTVYRNLNVLEDMGLVQKLSGGASFDRYDANTKPHIHFLCKECKKLIDVHDDIPSSKLVDTIASIDMQVDMYDLTCYGVCEDCSGKHH